MRDYGNLMKVRYQWKKRLEVNVTKLNWNRSKIIHGGIRAWEPVKKSKPITGHEGHQLVAEKVNKPHYAKLSCVTCGKFVKWCNETEYFMYK